MEEFIVDTAQEEDLPEIAVIFSLAFKASLDFFLKDKPVSKTLFRDLFRLLHLAGPEAVFVAREKGKGNIIGYLVVATNIRLTWLKIIFHGRWFKVLLFWLTGKYGIGLGQAFRVAKNKILFLKSEMSHGPLGQARILSLAVHPDKQGKKAGSRLLEKGLSFLKEQKVTEIKLEVRPHNKAARRLYGKMGFYLCGAYTDLQGEWLILRKSLAEA